MGVEGKNILNRIYIVALVILLLAIAITVKLTNIQWVQGDHFRKLAKDRTVKSFVIPSNKGNVYSYDGSL
ncbi:MAG: penicillin-binding protein, partial [Flavobacterium sp.]|nr:penicillin-binding protein [Flavobacterium sp.]